MGRVFCSVWEDSPSPLLPQPPPTLHLAPPGPSAPKASKKAKKFLGATKVLMRGVRHEKNNENQAIFFCSRFRQFVGLRNQGPRRRPELPVFGLQGPKCPESVFFKVRQCGVLALSLEVPISKGFKSFLQLG